MTGKKPVSMNDRLSMSEVAAIVHTFDRELRLALSTSRSGLFRNSNGELYVKANVPLGQRYTDEVISIFADEADLDFFYKIYGKDTK